MFTKQVLEQLYIADKKSVRSIAEEYRCSEGKVNYWLQKYSIPKRSISEAVYLQNNPNGNPFTIQKLQTSADWFMYGLGIGLYWGEGNKRNDHAIRLGNTDPDLLKTFLKFLTTIYNIDTDRLRFGLQIFNDIDPDEAKSYWCQKLLIKSNQFQKIVVSNSLHKKGTYRKKSEYGVLTIYFSNKKLRDTIVHAIEELRYMPM